VALDTKDKLATIFLSIRVLGLARYGIILEGTLSMLEGTLYSVHPYAKVRIDLMTSIGRMRRLGCKCDIL